MKDLVVTDTVADGFAVDAVNRTEDGEITTAVALLSGFPTRKDAEAWAVQYAKEHPELVRFKA